MRKPRGKTGPTTEQGKQISSRNASKHNCTSTRLIVEGETAAGFTALLESLTAEYQPETEMQQIVVNEAARAAWELARANREFDKSQRELYSKQENMRDWDAAQQSEFERMLRYRTRAERTFGRKSQAVEHVRKLHLQARQRAFWQDLQQQQLSLSKQRLKLSATRIRKAEARLEAKEKAQAPRVIEWPSPIVPVSQLVEVRIIDGSISIQLRPEAEDMHLRADLAQAGAVVLRRFEFPDGIPAGYAWVNGPDIRHKGIVWEQCFDTVQAWRDHVAHETATAPGHYLPQKRPDPH